MRLNPLPFFRTWCLRASLLALPVAYVVFSSYSNGISGQSTSGCSCHGSNASTTMLTISGIPTSGWVAGQAYSMTATVTNSARTGAGFDLSVSTGTLSSAGTGATLVGTTEIRHNTTKVMSSGSASWTFTWTAPASGTTVNFNFAGNAVNRDNNSSGDVPNQTTLSYSAAAVRPTATTNAATGVTTGTATLNGTANAGGNSGVTASFEYGTSSALGNTATATPSSITGTTNTTVTGSLSGLNSGTTYFYRIKLTSTLGTDSGAILSFVTQTPANPPVFGATSATAVTTSTATVSTRITPNSSAAFGLKYGLTPSFGQTAMTSPTSGSGTSPIAVSANLSGLTPNRKYYYAFTASTSTATTASATDSFTTGALSVAGIPLEQIAVYPNPVQHTLYWSLPAGTPVSSVQAFTMSGQLIALDWVQTGHTTQADISGLASGVYYLLLKTGDKTYGATFRKD